MGSPPTRVGSLVRRTPILSFIAAALFFIAAANEGHLNHWGITIVLIVVALCSLAIGVYRLRE
jgi:hypothetical protein